VAKRFADNFVLLPHIQELIIPAVESYIETHIFDLQVIVQMKKGEVLKRITVKINVACY
jgi:hypothetical protein